MPTENIKAAEPEPAVPVDEKPEIEAPVMTLFDLFGITVEEQRQAQPKPAKKKSNGNGKSAAKPKKAATAPILDLFGSGNTTVKQPVSADTPKEEDEYMTEEEARQERFTPRLTGTPILPSTVFMKR